MLTIVTNFIGDLAVMILGILVLIYPVMVKFMIFMTIASIIHYTRLALKRPQRQMSKKRAKRLAKGLPETKRKKIKVIK